MRDGRVKHLADGARARGHEIARNAARLDVPWARCDFARVLRELILSAGFGPLMGFYMRRRAVGREVLDGIEPPVIFVANHNSHVDTPLILRMLPARWRQRVAVAAAATAARWRQGAGSILRISGVSTWLLWLATKMTGGSRSSRTSRPTARLRR